MYGKPVKNEGPSRLPVGVSPVTVSVEFRNDTVGNYTGPFIDVNYFGVDEVAGVEERDRIFPGNVGYLTEDYNQKFSSEASNMQWFKKQYPTLDAYLEAVGAQTVTNKVQDILLCYYTDEQVDAFFAELGTLITDMMTPAQKFQAMGQHFAKKMVEVPTNATKTVYLARGYCYGKDFPSGPKETRHCQPWIHSEPFNVKWTKQFREEPFGAKSNSEKADQNQEVEAEF